jgi:phosphoribosylglycinamide formyltransferase 1
LFTERWAIFISGRGSNLSSILNLQNEKIKVVVSSSAKALGVLRARRAGIPVLILPRPIQWAELDHELKRRGINRIFLLGFMRVIPKQFVETWDRRIVNLHPSLLPNYPGLDSIERSFNDRADMGVTVHEVVAEVDAGKTILQRRCLSSQEIPEYSLSNAEFKVHIDEQRLVEEAFLRWRLHP